MCVVPVSTFRVNGALLVFPLRVYRLTWYLVPGCRPLEKQQQQKNGKTSPKHQNHTSDFLKVCSAGRCGVPLNV